MTTETSLLTAILVLVLLVLGLLAIAVYQIIALQRRLLEALSDERARGDARALATKAAVLAASSTEIAAVVAPVRVMLAEQERYTTAMWARAHAEVGGLITAERALCEWLFAFTDMLYRHAWATAAVPPETFRKPDRTPESRERPSPSPLKTASPQATTPASPEPAQVAAGLSRPTMAGRAKESSPPATGPRNITSITSIGLGGDQGGKGPRPIAPTLPSMPAVSPSQHPRPHQGETIERGGS